MQPLKGTCESDVRSVFFRARKTMNSDQPEYTANNSILCDGQRAV